MLVLTRKAGESIYIDDDIQIVVEEIRHNQVRIGIEAPEEMSIYREEIYDDARASKESSNGGDEEE